MRSNGNIDVGTGHHRTVPLDRAMAEDLVAQATWRGLRDRGVQDSQRALVAYAMPVVKDALRSGKMPKLLSDKGVIQAISASDRVVLHTSLEARDDLAIDTVAAGEDHLKKITIPKNRWKPDEGASIETFFVTGCLFSSRPCTGGGRKSGPTASPCSSACFRRHSRPACSNVDTAETATTARWPRPSSAKPTSTPAPS